MSWRKRPASGRSAAASTSGSFSNTSIRPTEYCEALTESPNGLNHGPFGEKNFNIPNGRWLAVKRFHSDVCDVTGYDAAEFSGELLLELEAHVGRAAERVGQLVQDGTDDRLPEASTTARSEN
jgi:hypothetical protein